MSTSRTERELATRACRIALRTASAIVGSREEAVDIAQDVAVDVLRSIGQLRDPDAFDAWVHRITVRHALKALRRGRSSARAEIPLALVAEHDEPVASGIDLDELLAARAALATALTTLPPKQRLALALRYVHDLTDREIAEALGCRRGTVNALLSRARATLRTDADILELVPIPQGDAR
jgi:RNA polymerase sigma-70 factor (ECF subfamily)